MSYLELQAKYNRLFQENIAWKLLRTPNAPFTLAFIADVFSEANEVPFNRARIALDAELARCREFGIWQTETNANTYLRQWIRDGWLREMNDILTKTDASEIASRFCQGLDERMAGTTASHFRIVQEAVRDLAIAINPNADERILFLERKKAEIQREIEALEAGIIVELSEAEQRERIREIYQLASALTGDFRRVEDEIRKQDKAIRVEMIEEGATRGDMVLSIIEKEALLATTEAGSAFEGFFQLLCDLNRSTEFREQLRNILSRPAAEHLTISQQQFLSKLMRELERESDRVFVIRRRIEKSLRAYIDSGVAQEKRAIDQLLGSIERIAVQFKDVNFDFNMTTPLSISTGAIKISSPESMRLQPPNERLDASGVTEQLNSRNPDSQILDRLDTVQVRDVAEEMRMVLEKHGPMSIASITGIRPIRSGLEELVACFRVARAINATLLEEKEIVDIQDKQGLWLRVRIPVLMLSGTLFPNDLDELML